MRLTCQFIGGPKDGHIAEFNGPAEFITFPGPTMPLGQVTPNEPVPLDRLTPLHYIIKYQYCGEAYGRRIYEYVDPPRFFDDVCPALRAGEKVRRRCWDERTYLQRKGNRVYQYWTDRAYPLPAAVVDRDLLADDWEVID